MSNNLNIGLFGFGCVGEGLYNVLNEAKLIDARISKIVVKDKTKKRSIAQNHFTFEKETILDDETINVVVELIDDCEAAYDIVKTALSKGKHVVSANKKLIAERLDELISLAKKNKVSFLYEASVAAAIPIIRNLEEYYNNDTLSSVKGIVNGTTNYILSEIDKGKSYQEALKEAQIKGYAESNPTNDVDGYDAKFKLVILLKHAFGLNVTTKQIRQVGIRNIKPQDALFALEKGYRIKLVATAERKGDDIIAFVAPRFVAPTDNLYQVSDAFNAVEVEGAFADKQLFFGKGAGSYPTASAVLSDLSALKFNYQYEYKKDSPDNELQYKDDFYFKIYLGSPYIELINKIPFLRIDEVFQSKDYSYQTGWVSYKEIAEFDFNKLPDLSLIVLPEPTIATVDLSKLKSTNIPFAIEF